MLLWDGVLPVPGAGAAGEATYEKAKGYRRGMSVSLGDDVTISGADPNGSSYDFFVTVEPTIVAVCANTSTNPYSSSTSRPPDLAISSTNYNGYLFLAHLRSRSRYTSARFFLE